MEPRPYPPNFHREPQKLQATQALAVTNSSRRKTLRLSKKSNARVGNRTDASDFKSLERLTSGRGVP
jgi:hypothetical protein